ncbi:MAG: hypothetical protein ACLTTZ_04930 [Lachnospiraceae bacterium]
MKQYMKYVTALLFVLSLVILLFLPVITVDGYFSVDVLRLGGQAGSGSGVFAELLSYLEPYFWDSAGTPCDPCGGRSQCGTALAICVSGSPDRSHCGESCSDHLCGIFVFKGQ